MKKILIRLLNDTFDGPKICSTSSGRFAIYTFDYSLINALEKNKLSFTKPGFYILLDRESNFAYIGVSNNPKKRWKNHNDSKKHPFSEIIYITSENNLRPYDKDEQLYIENKLIQLFENNSYTVDNKNRNAKSHIFEYDKQMLNNEYEEIVQSLKLLGFLIDAEPLLDVKEFDDRNPYFVKVTPKSKPFVHALFHVKEQKIYFQPNTEIITNIRSIQPYTDRTIDKIRQLYDTKTIEIKDLTKQDAWSEYADKLRHRQNYHLIFKKVCVLAPSAAIQIVKGQALNGWNYWITKNKKPISEFR